MGDWLHKTFPRNTNLTDVGIMIVRMTLKPKECARLWPATFKSNGLVRTTRILRGPPVLVLAFGLKWILTIDNRTILCGGRLGRQCLLCGTLPGWGTAHLLVLVLAFFYPPALPSNSLAPVLARPVNVVTFEAVLLPGFHAAFWQPSTVVPTISPPLESALLDRDGLLRGRVVNATNPVLAAR